MREVTEVDKLTRVGEVTAVSERRRVKSNPLS